MNNLNLTLNIKSTKGSVQKTYYSINAISKANDLQHCIIHSNGEQDVCLTPFNEMWEKLNKIHNESITR
jgi:tRNA uridine 5-carbamoylmethylation protein Kti12